MSNEITKTVRSAGVYKIILPPGLQATVTYYMWGAGGAAAGHDGGGPHGKGAGGCYTTGTVEVTGDDIIRFAIGEGGKGGKPGTSRGAGNGGRSLIGYSGGRGGNPGSRGWSGGGGGGGGATVLQVNDANVAVAGGGAGGGGGSHQRAGYDGLNTHGGASTSRGDQGQDMPGDGAGGGGGGGGLVGGAGGAYGPDKSRGGAGGKTGTGGTPGVGQNPPTTSNGWVSPAGIGGKSESQNGGDGLVILHFAFHGLGQIKNDGEWKDITDVFYKKDGDWVPVTSVAVKRNGEWKTTTYSADRVVVLGSPGDYGI